MNLPFEFCWKKRCTIQLGFDDTSADATGTAHIPSGRAGASPLKGLMRISAMVCGLLKAFKLHISRVRGYAWGKKNGHKKKINQKILHLGVLGVGEQARAACRGVVAFGDTGIPFQLCHVSGEHGACACHRLRSGRGNVREEEPDQKQGLSCVFLTQIPCSEGRLVGVCISDTVSWKIAVLEVTQLQIR